MLGQGDRQRQSLLLSLAEGGHNMRITMSRRIMLFIWYYFGREINEISPQGTTAEARAHH